MTHKLLVVTYQEDLKQFQLFCHCLNKNWQGNQSLVVVMGSKTDQIAVEKIIADSFNSTWEISLKESVKTRLSGDFEQQLNKIFYSVTSNVEDVIVFDSKDFLLKPTNFSTFKRNDRYRVTYKIVNKRLVEMGYNLTSIIDQPIDHLPAVSNLTPWIWNIEQLTRCWDYLINKFGPYEAWNEFYPVTEIYAYYIYTLTDPARTIKFLTHIDMPFLCAGGWTGQNYNGMLKQVEQFDQQDTCIIWKHSRKLEDPRCIDITRSVLEKYGIDQILIDRVYRSDLIPT